MIYFEPLPGILMAGKSNDSLRNRSQGRAAVHEKPTLNYKRFSPSTVLLVVAPSARLHISQSHRLCAPLNPTNLTPKPMTTKTRHLLPYSSFLATSEAISASHTNQSDNARQPSDRNFLPRIHYSPSTSTLTYDYNSHSSTKTKTFLSTSAYDF